MFFAASRSPPRQWDILHSLPSIEYTAEERNRLRALNAYYQELVEREGEEAIFQLARYKMYLWNTARLARAEADALDSFQGRVPLHQVESRSTQTQFLPSLEAVEEEAFEPAVAATNREADGTASVGNAVAKTIADDDSDDSDDESDVSSTCSFVPPASSICCSVYGQWIEERAMSRSNSSGSVSTGGADASTVSSPNMSNPGGLVSCTYFASSASLSSMVGAVWHAASLSQGTLPDREDDRAVLAPETENAFCLEDTFMASEIIEALPKKVAGSATAARVPGQGHVRHRGLARGYKMYI